MKEESGGQGSRSGDGRDPDPQGPKRQARMKVLVVDDDATTRRILSRLLTSTFGVDVVEATNGMDGLLKLESESPDLVVTDVSMPILDGHAMLKAIRASPSLRDMPVVAVSSNADRDLIKGLINLGIAEYLLKPLDLTAAAKRLGKVVEEVRRAPRSQPRGAGATNRPKLLLVDPDPNFRQLFRSLLDAQFDIVEASSGPQGLQLAVGASPAVVAVSEGLTLLNESLLAAHLRALASPPRAIYLLHANEPPAADPDEPALFNGMVKKSFVPQVLLERWRAVSMSGGGIEGEIIEALRGPLQGEIESATQQTLGVMTQQDVSRLPDAELANLATEVMPAMTLTTVDKRLSILVAMFCSKDDGESIAGRIFGERIAWDAGANEAFSQLVETIGGRVRSSFDSRGIKLEQQPVAELAAESRPTSWGFSAVFQATSGERFAVGVGMPVSQG
ncbi:MAG: response regulator [Gemmatimonadota bacterium]